MFFFGLAACGDSDSKKFLAGESIKPPIVIENPEDSLWRGQLDYVRQVLSELIEISRNDGTLRSYMLPLRVAVRSKVKGMNEGGTYGPSDAIASCGWWDCTIVFTPTILTDEETVQDTSAHEFSHVLHNGHLHDAVWRSTYQRLQTQLLVRHTLKEFGIAPASRNVSSFPVPSPDSEKNVRISVDLPAGLLPRENMNRDGQKKAIYDWQELRERIQKRIEELVVAGRAHGVLEDTSLPIQIEFVIDGVRGFRSSPIWVDPPSRIVLNSTKMGWITCDNILDYVLATNVRDIIMRRLDADDHTRFSIHREIPRVVLFLLFHGLSKHTSSVPSEFLSFNKAYCDFLTNDYFLDEYIDGDLYRLHRKDHMLFDWHKPHKSGELFFNSFDRNFQKILETAGGDNHRKGFFDRPLIVPERFQGVAQPGH